MLTKTEKRTTEMALSKTITTENGLEFKDAYHRIINVRYTPPHDLVMNIAAYMGEEQARAGKMPVATFTVSFPDTSHDRIVGESTLLRGMYMALKEMPTFEDCKDC